jgi:hypothetical protein
MLIAARGRAVIAGNCPCWRREGQEASGDKFGHAAMHEAQLLDEQYRAGPA